METPTYQRRHEELQRISSRLKNLRGFVITGDGEDSFGSPKDIALSLFRATYELKETLKHEDRLPEEFRKGVENYCKTHPGIALALDIANQKKHLKLSKPEYRKTTKVIGEINTAASLFPSGTKVFITVDGEKIDCYDLCQQVLEEWEEILNLATQQLDQTLEHHRKVMDEAAERFAQIVVMQLEEDQANKRKAQKEQETREGN